MLTYATGIRVCALQRRKLQNLPSGAGIHVCHRHTCLRPPEAQLWII
ncbi:MAG: hypothetical protein SCH70_04715 [Candidatus Methanoperedens sp.]|nr:hypothetical protein [Candidatus Methanoperedens sp.]